MGDLDSIYLQGLAYLHSNDPASSKKLVNLCEEIIASSEWAGVTISESGDLSNLVSKLQKDDRNETKLLNKRLRDEGDEEAFPSKAKKGVIMSPLFTNSLTSTKSNRLNILKKDVKKVKK
ncbi:hypothetical protein ACHWQZ_G011736 [Mnemiopsis leidyi]